MEVSFIISSDELYTLLSLTSELSVSGQNFYNEALTNASICNLSGLIEKELAHYVNNELEIEPVIKMIVSAISQADNIDKHSEVWCIHSRWITLFCERYEYHENHWRITPIKEIKS